MALIHIFSDWWVEVSRICLTFSSAVYFSSDNHVSNRNKNEQILKANFTTNPILYEPDILIPCHIRHIFPLVSNVHFSLIPKTPQVERSQCWSFFSCSMVLSNLPLFCILLRGYWIYLYCIIRFITPQWDTRKHPNGEVWLFTSQMVVGKIFHLLCSCLCYQTTCKCITTLLRLSCGSQTWCQSEGPVVKFIHTFHHLFLYLKSN